MRITFLCSSLESGKDGVGDYAQRLAEECSRLGHPTAMVALNDRHIRSGPVLETGAVPKLRLGPGMRWPERIARAGEFIAEAKADAMSLQFVGYGFSNKGIVAGLTPRLKRLVGNRPLQVMLHELWIGGGPESSVKEELIGKLQRYFVLHLLRRMRPAVIHTNLPIHAELLAAAGLMATVLPLFGNIPIADEDGAADLGGWLRRGGCRATGMTRENTMVGGFFGSFYPEWSAEPLFTYLQAAADGRGQRLCLIAAGRLGRYGDEVWASLTARYGERICLVKMGELAPRELSQLFRLFDFGLPASPWHLIGKSSSAASILDHGVPLILVPDPHLGFRGEVAAAGEPVLLHRCDDHLAAKLLAGLPKAAPHSSVSRIASTFIAELGQR